MIQNKILTIIIPTYNMEKYLRKCMDSLIVSEENMQRLEVLVVNDGSKDSSSQIAHEYETKYPQTFRVIDKENGNYGSCINRGLKETSGEYVKVLDADDYFANDIFDKFVTFLLETEADLVINDFCVVAEDGDILEKEIYNLPKKLTIGNLKDSTIKRLFHHGITYKTEVVRSIGYTQTEGISYTDDEWVYKPMTAVNTIISFPYFLYYYLRGREGQTFDPEVLRKTHSQKVAVAKSLIDFFCTKYDATRHESQNYMLKKIICRIQPIYDFYLIKNNDSEGNLFLQDFDSFLRERSMLLYESMNEVKNRLGWHYILDWRRSGYNRNIFSLLILRLKYRLQNF